MLQKRHSGALGTQLGGVLPARRRIKAPSSWMNPLSNAPLGIRTVCGTGHDLTTDPDVPVLWQSQGQGVLVDHDLDFVPGLLLAGLDVDDGGVVLVQHDEVVASRQGGGPLWPVLCRESAYMTSVS